MAIPYSRYGCCHTLGRPKYDTAKPRVLMVARTPEVVARRLASLFSSDAETTSRPPRMTAVAGEESARAEVPSRPAYRPSDEIAMVLVTARHTDIVWRGESVSCTIVSHCINYICVCCYYAPLIALCGADRSGPASATGPLRCVPCPGQPIRLEPRQVTKGKISETRDILPKLHTAGQQQQRGPNTRS